MDTILVPATGHSRWTRAVADTVLDVEDTDAASVVVMYGFTEDDLSSTLENLDHDDGRPPLDELARRKSNVSEALDVLADSDVDCAVRGVEVEQEDSGEHVLSVASEEDADRIYMFSRRRSPTGKAVFGSALQDVLLNSSVPVVVVPSGLA